MIEALISWLSSWSFEVYCQIEQPGVCISVFPKTSNRVSYLRCCLVPVSIGFYPVLSDAEGYTAGGLGTCQVQTARQDPESKLFPLLPQTLWENTDSELVCV